MSMEAIVTKQNGVYVRGLLAPFRSVVELKQYVTDDAYLLKVADLVVAIISGRVDFDEDLLKALQALKDHYYSLGLKHMDRMHGTIDNME